MLRFFVFGFVEIFFLKFQSYLKTINLILQLILFIVIENLQKREIKLRIEGRLLSCVSV